MSIALHVLAGLLFGVVFFGGLRVLLMVFMHHGYADPIAMLLAFGGGLTAGVWTAGRAYVVAAAFGLGLLGVVLRFFFGNRGGWGT